jgi:uncharacterized protein
MPLIAVVGLAFAVEAALGFGATVLAMTLGAFFVSPKVLLPALLPLNVVLSAVIVSRSWRSVDLRLLLRRVLPPMVLGMPIGMAILRFADGPTLIRILGAIVAFLSLLELLRRSSVPLRPAIERACIGAAGVIHGAFGTGGPLVVYAMGRVVDDKARFRATLSSLWLLLNIVLGIGFWFDGRIDVDSLTTSLQLAGGLAIGLFAGERLFQRLDRATFSRAVWIGLLVAGMILIVR